MQGLQENEKIIVEKLIDNAKDTCEEKYEFEKYVLSQILQ